MPTLSEALLVTTTQLCTVIPDHKTARFEAETLLACILKRDRSWLIAHDDITLTPGQLRRLQALLQRRLQHEPLAYLLGEWYFYGLTFRIDRRALIPRPETELLVDQGLAWLDASSTNALALDIGTGSGAVAIAIARRRPTVSVIASDVDRGALSLARTNARRLLPTQRVAFVQADLFDRTLQTRLKKSQATQLVILGNLPYLPRSDKKNLAPEVTRYEPSRALFAADAGLALIKRLLKQIAAFRRADARPICLALEFDPPQAMPLLAYARRLFPDAQLDIKQDLCGRDRMLLLRAGRGAVRKFRL